MSVFNLLRQQALSTSRRTLLRKTYFRTFANSSTAPPVALITGASQGIGRSIALRLADDGMDIAINDIPSKASQIEEVIKEITSKGRRAVAVPADVSSEEEVRAMVENTVSGLGALDVLVANAGICRAMLITEHDTSVFDRIWAVNARGPFLCFKYAALQMIKQGRGGRILAASSIAGEKGLPYLSAYCAAKHAVVGLTETAAREFMPHRITVNAYAPGAINTDMLNVFEKEENKSEDTLPPVLPADPEVIASIVSYLTKPEAHYITGQVVVVDGGALLSGM